MERIDDLQYKGLKLIQDDELFCFGCDAVELANFVKGSNADACDLGCGNGIIATLIAAKRGMRVTGVEIQPESASLAERNARLNSLADRIEIVCARMQDFAAQCRQIQSRSRQAAVQKAGQRFQAGKPRRRRRASRT